MPQAQAPRLPSFHSHTHSHPPNTPSFWAFLNFPSKAKTTGTFLPSFSKAAP